MSVRSDDTEAPTSPPPSPADPAATTLLPSQPAGPDAAAPLPSVPGYEVLRELGRGGMGVVYQARQLGFNRLVALKMILAGEYAGAEERARFRAEAEAVARLQHPNIVQIHEVGEHDGRPFFSMEFCPGGGLDTCLNATPLPQKEAASLVETLARAVQAAHEKGVVHRDLKPANVLLAEDGAPKITDFGLARKLDEAGLTASGAVMGTPSYMAPEQAGGKSKEIGPARDVYALGAILYECLTGRPPFKGPTTLDTLTQVLSAEAVPPRQLQPKTPRDLETICLKCLEKQASRRYATAAELADDLGRWRRDEPVRARPIEAVERAVRWARRKPALAAAYGLLAAVLVLSGGGALWYELDRDARNAKAERDKEAAERQRQLTEKAVRADLREAARLREQGAWAKAKAVVEHAQGQLAAGGAPDLAKEVQQASADLKVVAALEEVQVAEAADFNAPKAEEGYAAAFRDYGLALDELKPQEAADRIKASIVHEQLIPALDDWIYVQGGHPTPGQAVPVELARLRDCVRLADDHKLRQQFRDLAEKQDVMELKRLAREPDVLHEPGLTLVILGMTLHDLNDAAAEDALLRRARVVYPNDFWVNYRLAQILSREGAPRNDEALGCYWTALALRPQSQSLYCDIYPILKTMGRTGEAADVAHKAVQLPGDSSKDHFILGGALDSQGEIEEAVAEYQKAIDCGYDYVGDVYWSIALLRQDQGRREDARKEFDQAAAAYRRACEQDPNDPHARCDLGQALLQQGRFTEAVQNLRHGSELAAQGKKGEPSCQLLSVAQRCAVLDAVLPLVLQGQAEPADAEATAALADAAQMPQRWLYAASARLYARAFSDDPRLMDNMDAGDPSSVYAAACVAALAAAGQGDDAGGLSPEERDRLRKQAVTWLRYMLDAWADQVDGRVLGASAAGFLGSPLGQGPLLAASALVPGRAIDSTEAAAVHRALKVWQVNADLAGLRDDAALAGLPQADQEACRKLWVDVSALLDRTAPSQ